jgi:hypothetical protein
MHHPHVESGVYYGHYSTPPLSHPIQALFTQYWHEVHYPGPHKKFVHVYYIDPAFVHYYMNFYSLKTEKIALLNLANP